MLGGFSRIPLAALLDAGIEICGVMVPAPRETRRPAIGRLTPRPSHSQIPILNPHAESNIVSIAHGRGLPVFEVSRPQHPDVLTATAELRPEAACVACFSKRLPPALLAVPTHGFLNLHPSLLPAYRGPEPLFWAFRSGEMSTGVTIHFLDEGLDTGDIALQAPLDLPDGIDGAAASLACATLGARLLVEAVRSLERGNLTRRPQTPEGDYDPAPTPADFSLNTTWPARRAFNFMRGTEAWAQPYRIDVGRERHWLKSAVAFEAADTTAEPLIWSGDCVRIRFSPGVLIARPA